MTLVHKGQRIDPRDEVVIQREDLHPVRDGLGIDGAQPVEGDVQCVDSQLGLLVKVVANVLNLIAMEVQPVEGAWQEEVVKLLDAIVGDVEPAQASQIAEQANNVRYAIGVQADRLQAAIVGKGPAGQLANLIAGQIENLQLVQTGKVSRCHGLQQVLVQFEANQALR